MSDIKSELDMFIESVQDQTNDLSFIKLPITGVSIVVKHPDEQVSVMTNSNTFELVGQAISLLHNAYEINDTLKAKMTFDQFTKNVIGLSTIEGTTQKFSNEPDILKS